MTAANYRLVPEGSPTFSFKQVEAILARAFGIAEGKRKTFAARLQQLQKLGLPKGTNTGRGTRAAYETWQLCEFQFYLDLLQAGVPPALVAARFANSPFYTVDGWGRFAETMAARGEAYYAHIRINALDHLTSESETVPAVESPTYTEYSGGKDLAGVIRLAEGRPGVLLDLAKRMRSLKAAVAAEVPSVSDTPLFQHLAGE